MGYHNGAVNTACVSDPYIFDTDLDPAKFSAEYRPDKDPIRIQGFDDQ
jgi:hypothetical protein